MKIWLKFGRKFNIYASIGLSCLFIAEEKEYSQEEKQYCQAEGEKDIAEDEEE
jgi:hypothetical protein